MKIALFDFCETLVDFQTADAYVHFVQTNSPITHRIIKCSYEILNKSHLLGIPRRLFPMSSIDKRLIIRQMKGRAEGEMRILARQYYERMIKPALIKDVLTELLNKKNEGYKIYLISGGYGIYLQYFALEYDIEGIISTNIDFKNGICTGKFTGHDCMFEHKIDYIKQTISDDHYDDWFAYTDSITDLPMLKMVGHPVVISREKSQKWAEQKGYSQIIWNKFK